MIHFTLWFYICHIVWTIGPRGLTNVTDGISQFTIVTPECEKISECKNLPKSVRPIPLEYYNACLRYTDHGCKFAAVIHSFSRFDFREPDGRYLCQGYMGSGVRIPQMSPSLVGATFMPQYGLPLMILHNPNLTQLVGYNFHAEADMCKLRIAEGQFNGWSWLNSLIDGTSTAIYFDIRDIDDILIWTRIHVSFP
eukprot:Gregarina_sp_Poly_1__209@NODE_1049_length_5236_cov_775_534146_g729_i0_p3_GENE_NODE_1049_length_5236_cov_775_534146_g729_i0NODE_1049_length_5236_cov_775_534146_g729_i0_p3_ORF_typecomplete_len195_score10_66DUF2587/PF10759_9/0_12_NODE_1049_length_5236_cov_775_534146_g729_i025333117